MALGGGLALLRAAAGALRGPGRPLWGQGVPGVPPSRPCSAEAPPKPSEPPSPYKEKPWEYLESAEYQEAYGDKPVWFGYRRHHKGAVPPRHTRKACLRKGKRVGNPCPICRDRHLFVDFRNVKLLDQFICPHSGSIFHPTHTGVCMKQHKLLLKAIAQAQDHGLLWLRIPFVPVPQDDFAARPPAVGKTPPAPQLTAGRAWYPWYDWQQPPPDAVARLRRLYKDYLRQEEGGPAPGGAPEAQ
ncbi:small ribosomal subunit protein mS40 isoform X1 [Anser cygnoides]|uniref:small ribosomal subunit protein mS40 isoform X1 n=1 Tax=Anser cygnoides TaxID=8845 RepID=UPI0034D2F151